MHASNLNQFDFVVYYLCYAYAYSILNWLCFMFMTY